MTHDQEQRILGVVRGERSAKDLSDEEVLELALATMDKLVEIHWARNLMTFSDHLTLQ